MKLPIATMALACTLTVPAALVLGQTPRTAPSLSPPAVNPAPDLSLGAPSGPAGVAAPTETNANPVMPAPSNLQPTHPDEFGAPTIELPNDPIEPYLLTKEIGPFLVLAKTFRGPNAERYALALVLELRQMGYPSYILRTRDFPARSNIRNIPPTAPSAVNRAQVTMPERVRTYEEAAVLVGNEKTQKGAELLLCKVKKLRPRCLSGMPSIFPFQEGLRKALRTTNPYVPAQDLFSAPPDPLVAQMNGGPHSVFNCPARYTLQVAEFGGRSTFNADDRRFLDDKKFLGRSPLGTAFDDAEKLAENLSKDEDVRRMGYQAYVYHDRTSSRVMFGAFKSPDDPAAAKVRMELLKLTVPLANKKVTPTYIVPANQLTDLEPIKNH
jgi:hypothetical protein